LLDPDVPTLFVRQRWRPTPVKGGSAFLGKRIASMERVEIAAISHVQTFTNRSRRQRAAESHYRLNGDLPASLDGTWSRPGYHEQLEALVQPASHAALRGAAILAGVETVYCCFGDDTPEITSRVLSLLR
jgi:hypothetical protein